jgi:hypothetical protein
MLFIWCYLYLKAEVFETSMLKNFSKAIVRDGGLLISS